MPNWTSCRLEAPADVLKKYTGKDEDGCRIFDFNLVIPRPEIYNDPDLSSGGDTENCIYWYLSNKGKMTFPEIVKLFPGVFGRFLFTPNQDDLLRVCKNNSESYFRRGKKYVDAFRKYGYTNWYDWSYAKWGTKWNACDSTFDTMNDEPEWVSFDTAWCYPEPIVKKIFADNPHIEMSFTWEDEDYDGTYTLAHYDDDTTELTREYLKRDWEEGEDDNEEEIG